MAQLQLNRRPALERSSSAASAVPCGTVLVRVSMARDGVLLRAAQAGRNAVLLACVVVNYGRTR